MSSTTTRSIMVVDDEVELATLFKAFLTKDGYDVMTFVDPVMAFDYFKETSHKHSLIITDLRMPGMCGLELAKKIRQVNLDIKIFLMTPFDISDLKENPDFHIAK